MFKLNEWMLIIFMFSLNLLHQNDTEYYPSWSQKALNWNDNNDNLYLFNLDIH
jgi:hypothetical protein